MTLRMKGFSLMTRSHSDFLWGASSSPHQIEGNNVNC